MGLFRGESKWVKRWICGVVCVLGKKKLCLLIMVDLGVCVCKNKS